MSTKDLTNYPGEREAVRLTNFTPTEISWNAVPQSPAAKLQLITDTPFEFEAYSRVKIILETSINAPVGNDYKLEVFLITDETPASYTDTDVNVSDVVFDRSGESTGSNKNIFIDEFNSNRREFEIALPSCKRVWFKFVCTCDSASAVWTLNVHSITFSRLSASPLFDLQQDIENHIGKIEIDNEVIEETLNRIERQPGNAQGIYCSFTGIVSGVHTFSIAGLPYSNNIIEGFKIGHQVKISMTPAIYSLLVAMKYVDCVYGTITAIDIVAGTFSVRILDYGNDYFQDKNFDFHPPIFTSGFNCFVQVVQSVHNTPFDPLFISAAYREIITHDIWCGTSSNASFTLTGGGILSWTGTAGNIQSVVKFYSGKYRQATLKAVITMTGTVTDIVGYIRLFNLHCNKVSGSNVYFQNTESAYIKLGASPPAKAAGILTGIDMYYECALGDIYRSYDMSAGQYIEKQRREPLGSLITYVDIQSVTGGGTITDIELSLELRS